MFFRIGTYYDQSPVEENNVSPEAPERSHMAPTFGLGVRLSDAVEFDLSYISQKYSGETATGAAGFEYKYNRGIDVLSFSATISIGNKKEPVIE